MNNNNIKSNEDELTLNNNNCDICYENSNDNFILQCCNGSKQICVECVSCLTKYICPYCRKELPEYICEIIGNNNINKYNTLSVSAPETSHNNGWHTFIENEYLIDPFADYYHNRDSRILRRRMRQLRKRYLERNLTRNRDDNYTQTRRQQRHNLRTYTNNLTTYYQRNSNSSSRSSRSSTNESINSNENNINSLENNFEDYIFEIDFDV